MTDLDERLRQAMLDISRDVQASEDFDARMLRRVKRRKRRARALTSLGVALVLGMVGVGITARKPSAPSRIATQGKASPLVPTGWTPLPPPPVARGKATVAATGDGLFYFGGYESGVKVRADVFLYSTVTRQWKELAPSPLAPRAQAHAFATGSDVTVWGGIGEGGVPLVDGALYRAADDSWELLPPAPLAPRDKAAVAWTGQELVVWGGQEAHDGRWLYDGARFNLATRTWRALAPAPRELLVVTATWTGRQLLVAGARSLYESQVQTVAYDPQTDSWSVGDVLKLSPRAASSALVGGQVILWDYLLTAHAFDTGTGSWRSLPPPPFEDGECVPSSATVRRQLLAWYCGQAALLDPTSDSWRRIDAPPDIHGQPVAVGETVLFAGASYEANYNSLWEFAPGEPPKPAAPQGRPQPATGSGEGGRWSAVFEAPAPGRRGPQAVWTGTKVLIWGGANAQVRPIGTPFLYDGLSYDPATGQWDRIPPSPFPVGGAVWTDPGGGAVWTGREMVVWARGSGGGQSAAMIYEPEAHQWRISSPPPAGMGTISASVVWTGKEMIVWGGTDHAAGGPTQGVAYSPATDSWRSISPAPPPNRQFHTAVWTGREMLVWGGTDWVGPYRADGLAYDPETDAWRTIPPSPLGGRTQLDAVWTGSEMIVWDDGLSPPFATGPARPAAYSPATNTWRILPPAPIDVRRSASILWTGREMVVFGGYTPGSPNTLDDDVTYDDGAAYDPSTDRWRPLAPAPMGPRCDHVAVWAGSSMFVWGGSENCDSVRPVPASGATWSP